MQESLKLLRQLRSQPNFPSGLATVTATQGSSYRRPGARMLLYNNGLRFGSISGGCLEEDMVVHLKGVMESGQAKAILYDTTQENDLVWGVGLGCNGQITLLLEPLVEVPAALVFTHRAAEQNREGCALAIVYRNQDSTLLGARLGMTASGKLWQDRLLVSWRDPFEKTALSVIANRRSISMIFNGLEGCPSVFFEYIPPTPHLLILGAGDDAQPLADLAAELGWAVTVVDPRPAYATRERFPTANQVLVVKPEEIAQKIGFDEHTFAVIMTHHYVHDLPFLDILIDKPLAYLGLLGPKQRADRLVGELRRNGRLISEAALKRLHAPVGLDLGGDAPPAVALSILAELQAALHQRDGGHLKDRVRPIHN